jgi:hypothetical protein
VVFVALKTSLKLASRLTMLIVTGGAAGTEPPAVAAVPFAAELGVCKPVAGGGTGPVSNTETHQCSAVDC